MEKDMPKKPDMKKDMEKMKEMKDMTKPHKVMPMKEDPMANHFKGNKM